MRMDNKIISEIRSHRFTNYRLCIYANAIIGNNMHSPDTTKAIVPQAVAQIQTDGKRTGTIDVLYINSCGRIHLFISRTFHSAIENVPLLGTKSAKAALIAAFALFVHIYYFNNLLFSIKQPMQKIHPYRIQWRRS